MPTAVVHRLFDVFFSGGQVTLVEVYHREPGEQGAMTDSDLETIEKTPHITCVLGSGRFQGLGLDQLQGQRASDGQRTHTDLMPMTMTYHCQAKSGMTARRVAWNASFYTIQLRRIIILRPRLL